MITGSQSKAGTRVPFRVLMPAAAARDGSHACVVTGYGDYGVNLEPHFCAGRCAVARARRAERCREPAWWQFAALYAYSPYHCVQQNKAYPATFLLTGENDPRVGPLQTRKMAALLQAATAGSHTPVLFLSQPANGHGSNMPIERRISERSDVFAFMLSQLNVPYRPVTAF